MATKSNIISKLSPATFATLAVILSFLGCTQSNPPTPEQSQEVTYTGRVSSILNTHCIMCHNPDGAGPFSLMEYRQAARKSKTIAKVTRKGYMPPWPADREYTTFLHEPTITSEEIKILQNWAINGAPYGDSSQFTPPSVLHKGFIPQKPDLTVGLAHSIPIEGDNRDRFFALKIPVELEKERYLRAIEFIPGNHKLVHHMNGHLVNFDADLMEDMHRGQYILEHDSVPSRTLAHELGFRQDDSSFPRLTPSVVNYLPGVGGTLYPKGIGGYYLSSKFALYIKDLHIGPTPVPASDSSYFNLYFMPNPPERPLRELHLGSLGIAPVQPTLAIPPNKEKDFTISYVIPQKISVLTINPHMHLLGKKFKAYAIEPKGDTIPLIRISQWDFRWQYFYTYPKPVVLAAGSEIKVEATFDNTSSNKYNPKDPPEWVRERQGSMRTTDEMLQFFITYLPYQAGDEYIDLSIDEEELLRAK